MLKFTFLNQLAFRSVAPAESMPHPRWSSWSCRRRWSRRVESRRRSAPNTPPRLVARAVAAPWDELRYRRGFCGWDCSPNLADTPITCYKTDQSLYNRAARLIVKRSPSRLKHTCDLIYIWQHSPVPINLWKIIRYSSVRIKALMSMIAIKIEQVFESNWCFK